MLLTEIEERLRDVDLRVTASRVAVLRVLADSEDHPRVDEVIERVRALGLSMSTQAAYDVCETLGENGLAQRIAPAGGAARYDAQREGHHDHLVCRTCGRTIDVDCGTDASCLTLPELRGFVIEQAEVTLWGTCSSCASGTG